MSAKRFIQIVAAIAAAAFSVSSPSKASNFDMYDAVCPVDGMKFRTIRYFTNYDMPRMPDGQPYGVLGYKTENLPVCPDNGLPLYREFTPKEVPALEKVVRSAEFQALRDEVSFYRAAWLMKEFDHAPPKAYLWMINQASWQVQVYDNKPALKARYQREFAEGVDKLEYEPTDTDWVTLTYYAANAWRVLSEFGRAQATLKRLESGLRESGDHFVRPGKSNLRTDIYHLKNSIWSKDASPDPLELVPLDHAVHKCLEIWRTKQVPFPLSCNKHQVRTRMSKIINNNPP